MAPTISKATLSVCMIVRNEAHCLAKCLQSIQAVADEIIVLDTGSSDQSQQIAQQFGARVFDYVWHDDFAAARNMSLTYATRDWVLVIDADEYLAEESIAVLNDFLSQPREPERVLVRCCSLDNQGQHQKIYHLVRLFARQPQLRFEGAFHEYLQDSNNPPLNCRFMPEILLWHDGYSGQRSQQTGKPQRNRYMLNQRLAQDPLNPVWYYYSANEYKTAGEYQRARQEFKRVLELCAQSPDHKQVHFEFLARSVTELMDIEARQKQSIAGLQLAEYYFEDCKNLPDYWFCLGVLYRQNGQIQRAIGCFELCLQFDPLQIRFQYMAATICQGPLLQLLYIYRLNHYHPAHSRLHKEQALKQLITTLTQALKADSHPAWQDTIRPYIFEAAILAQQSGIAWPAALQTETRFWSELMQNTVLQTELQAILLDLKQNELQTWLKLNWSDYQAGYLDCFCHAAFIQWKEPRWVLMRIQNQTIEQARTTLLDALSVMPEALTLYPQLDALTRSTM